MDQSSESGCPGDAELLGLLAADSKAPASLAGHLEGCGECTSRLARLQSEVKEINSLALGLEIPKDPSSDEFRVEGPSSVEKFVDDLKQSQLADPDQIESWCLDSDFEAPDATSLAATLVLKQHLSPFQASQLLDGNPQGVLLGNHKLIEPLGRGGMGIVFKAEHITLHRLDALKVLKQDLTGDQRAVSRFLREAQLLAAMSHDNIVRVHDLGQDDQLYYIVMEYVPGGSLKERMGEAARLGVEESLGMILQVALALDHAHQHGIIHRDVKPSNILVTPDGQAKLSDLGRARAFDETLGSSKTASNLTLAGTFMGTVDYMSPEQAEDPRKADIRSDLYALGCTLYECLSGEVPYAARNRAAQLMLARAGHVRRINTVDESIPEAVAELTHRLMARLPEERYQTPREAIEAIEACLSQSSPTPPGPRPQRPSQPGQPGKRRTTRPKSARQVAQADRGFQSSTTGRDLEEAVLAIRRARVDQSGRRLPTRKKSRSTRRRRLDRKWLSVLAALALVVLLVCWSFWPGPSVAPDAQPAPLSLQLQQAVRFEDLKKQVASVLTEPVDAVEANRIRDELLLARAETAGFALKREFHGLLHRLPAPADGLSARSISAAEIEAARVGPSRALPEGLVAVMGDSRMKHWNRVHGLAASRDGRILVSGSYDATIRIWDPRTGILKRTLRGHLGPVTSVAISPDARTIASGSHDQSIRLWATDDGREIRRISARSGFVWSVEFDADGATLLSAHHSGEVNLWKTADGSRVSGVKAHQDPVLAVRFAPGGTQLATASLDHTVKIWDIADWKLVKTLSGHTLGVQTLDYSPDGRLLASGGQDGMVRIWDVATGKQIRELAASGHVATVRFDPSGRLLLFDTGNASLIWNVGLDKRHRALGKHLSSVISSCFLGESGVVITGGYEGSIKTWDVETGKERTDVSAAWTATFDPGASLLAVGFENGEVQQYELETGSPGHRFVAHGDSVVSVAYDLTGQRLATGGYDWNCRVWEAATGKPAGLNGRHASLVNSVAFAPGGDWFASGGWDRVVRLWFLDGTVATQREFPPGNGYVREVAFSPDRKWLAWAGQAGEITLFHLEKEVTSVICKSGSGVMSLCFNNDGRRLAVMRANGQVELWDVNSQRQIDWEPQRPFTSDGLSVRFDPRGIDLAMTATTGSIRIADAATGKHKGEIRVGPDFGRIWHLRYSPSGRYLATVNGNGTVYVLRVSSSP